MNMPNLFPLKMLRFGTAAIGMVLSLAAQAQNVIESVSGTIQGGAEVVRIELSQPLASAPVGFSIQSPARIALDFPGYSSALGRSSVEINQGNLRSVNVAQSGDRSRIVLNLKAATTYKTQQQGKTLLVFLDPVVMSAPSASATPVFAENRNRDALPLKDLDFKRGADDAGKVVVTLANSQVGVDIRQQGQTLVVEFMKSTLPEGLRRRLDVTDFGTPVQTVTTFQVGDRVRMVIEPKGVWEHSAYQTDTQFVVEVRPQKIDANRLTQGPSFTGEKLSLNFQNIEVRSLLQVIADFTNFNIITSDSVTGSVTLRLKDVPWDQAFQIIMDAKSLGVRKTGNVLLIAPKDELDAKTKKDLEAAQAIQNLEPLKTQSFQLNYAKATDIATQINGTGATGGGSTGGAGTTGRVLSARGSATAAPRTNQLFVTDISSKLEQVQQLIAKLDIAVRQVLIEARMVEASDTFGQSLGIRLGATDQRAQNGGTGGYQVGGGNSIAIGTSYGNVVATSGAGGKVDTTSNFINLPAVAQNGFNPATLAVSIFNATANRFLNLEISALEADGKGKVVSSPRVVTADQTKALIEQGTELPYQVATSSGATSIAFQKANLKLEVTPQITPEGSIVLDVDVTNDSLGVLTAAGYAINTKHIKTQVLVENGGTVVIGGIYTMNETDSLTQVPLLGDIPYLGNLFKTKSKASQKNEMLVFITPKVISERSTVR